MRLVISFLLALSTVSLHAQDCDPVFFGKDYTYMSFFIVPENDWQTQFWVVTDKDSITFDLSDIEAFIKSVLSTSETFVLYSPDGLKMAYGMKRDYNYRRFDSYRMDLFYQMDIAEKKAEFTLLTGERMFIDYADIRGMFARLEGECSKIGMHSHGLWEEIMPDTTIMLVGLIGCFPTSDKFKFITNEGK